MSYNYLPLDRKPVTFQQVKNLLDFDQDVSITFDAHERIEHCREYLDQKMHEANKLYYGINTGFGSLCNVQITDDQLEKLQSNLLRSHACGLGNEVPEIIVRLMMAFKIKSLSYGFSGVQIDTVKRLLDMYNARVWPVVYEQGSLGASGDLAPLSHLCLPLIGEGEVRQHGEVVPAAKVLNEKKWEPIHLKSKEGLALINGTQFMTAYGFYSLIKMERLLNWANYIAALSFDAFGCTIQPLHEKIQAIRPHPGQIKVAAMLRNILKGSELMASEKQQVQDPYSFRCVPQVHGASYDVFEHVKSVFIREINAVTDNPNVFPDDDLIVSGGNFHGQPLAMALDYLSIAIHELGSISERRTYQLISGTRGLPPFLVNESGLNSGLMIPQYTAAGIVSENKQLCTPSSADSIPSSNNQEDHVSMGANAGVKCRRIADNVEKILAIELITAAQALDCRRPLKTSTALENLLADFRQKVPFLNQDRILHNDMVAAIQFIQQYSLKINL